MAPCPLDPPLVMMEGLKTGLADGGDFIIGLLLASCHALNTTLYNRVDTSVTHALNVQRPRLSSSREADCRGSRAKQESKPGSQVGAGLLRSSATQCSFLSDTDPCFHVIYHLHRSTHVLFYCRWISSSFVSVAHAPHLIQFSNHLNLQFYHDRASSFISIVTIV